jgi:carbon-monoxide dehydrogenase small subunit
VSGSAAIELSVNGRRRPAAVDPRSTLLTVLRDHFALTGAKVGCNQGVCGACTVLVDGVPVRACLTLALASTGSEITTIEGLTPGKQLSRLQDAFADCGAVQCGFCTSGMIVAAHAFLQENPKPSIEEIRQGLSGNLCRCTGYKKIVDAVCRAAGTDGVDGRRR